MGLQVPAQRCVHVFWPLLESNTCHSDKGAIDVLSSWGHTAVIFTASTTVERPLSPTTMVTDACWRDRV
jgi:hypothetical protein